MALKSKGVGGGGGKNDEDVSNVEATDGGLSEDAHRGGLIDQVKPLIWVS